MGAHALVKPWRRGDILLHEADAKEPKMFMVVLGYTRDGLVKTQYLDRRYHRRTVWMNDLIWLKSVRDYGFYEYSKQEDYESVRIWNTHYPVGEAVVVHLDSGRDFETITTSTAQLLKGGDAVIWLKDVTGCYLLRAVKPIRHRGVVYDGEAS